MMATKTSTAVLSQERRLTSRHLAARFFGHTTQLTGERFVN